MAASLTAIAAHIPGYLARLKGPKMTPSQFARYATGVVKIAELAATLATEQDESKPQTERVQEEVASVCEAAPSILVAFGAPSDLANDLALPEVVAAAQALAGLAEVLIAKSAPANPTPPSP
ncbi:hypothetical protein KGP36_04005 [Patescibacteria group bacterium]|nr:hypothetical protein [Patescibacteria group bacterium]